jgi:hypothetical protein
MKHAQSFLLLVRGLGVLDIRREARQVGKERRGNDPLVLADAQQIQVNQDLG